MCGRFTLTPRDFAEITGLLGAVADPALAATYRPRFNLPPTDPHVIVVRDGARRLVAARWAFGRKKPIINARAESLATNGLFKQALRERRCLVPADGFYEWTGAAGRKRPIWFHVPRGQIFCFAGIFDESGFAIVTTGPTASSRRCTTGCPPSSSARPPTRGWRVQTSRSSPPRPTACSPPRRSHAG